MESDNIQANDEPRVEDGWISIKLYSNDKNISEKRLVKLIKKKKIVGIQHNNEWYINILESNKDVLDNSSPVREVVTGISVVIILLWAGSWVYMLPKRGLVYSLDISNPSPIGLAAFVAILVLLFRPKR